MHLSQQTSSIMISFEAENKILLADVGHYESEQFTNKLIASYLTKKMPNFACILSQEKTNPVNYF